MVTVHAFFDALFFNSSEQADGERRGGLPPIIGVARKAAPRRKPPPDGRPSAFAIGMLRKKKTDTRSVLVIEQHPVPTRRALAPFFSFFDLSPLFSSAARTVHTVLLVMAYQS